jgi:hypothetical protein
VGNRPDDAARWVPGSAGGFDLDHGGCGAALGAEMAQGIRARRALRYHARMRSKSLALDQRPPQGDVHRGIKQGALSALDDYFRRTGRRVYVSSDLLVTYPGEPAFVPDLLAVLDVDAQPRVGWDVDAELRRGEGSIS